MAPNPTWAIPHPDEHEGAEGLTSALSILTLTVKGQQQISKIDVRKRSRKPGLHPLWSWFHMQGDHKDRKK